MTPEQIIAAIAASIQEQDANVVAIIRFLILRDLANSRYTDLQIQNLCTILSIDTTKPPPGP